MKNRTTPIRWSALIAALLAVSMFVLPSTADAQDGADTEDAAMSIPELDLPAPGSLPHAVLGADEIGPHVIESGDQLQLTYDCAAQGASGFEISMVSGVTRLEIGNDETNSAGNGSDAIRASFDGNAWGYISVNNCPLVVVHAGAGDENISIQSADPASSIETLIVYGGSRSSGGDAVDETGRETVTVSGSAPEIAMIFILGRSNDTFTASDSHMTQLIVDAGRNDDVVKGGGGPDVLIGLGGADTLTGAGGDDEIFGGEGPDIIYGNEGKDRIRGQNGNDTIYGGPDNDNLNGNNGNDEVRGGDGHDYVAGKDGEDVLFGGNGTDTVNGGGKVDIMDGGNGNDTMNGNGFGDTMYGRAGNDTMAGGDGPDKVFGNDGNDDLDGNRGNDQLAGGPGNDTCEGRTGFDTASGCETESNIP